MTSHRPVSQLGGMFAAALILVGIAGCQAQPKPVVETTAPPANTEQAAGIRASILQSQPNALVGMVILSLEDKPYTAIGDIPVQDVKVDQAVTFFDGSGKPFNTGVVVRIDGDTVHVRFDSNGKRPPQKGDLAMIVKG